MSDEYELRTVADFLAFPREKWPALLADFAVWLEVTSTDCYVQWKDGDTERLVTENDVFIWIDDGKCDGLNRIYIDGVRYDVGADDSLTRSDSDEPRYVVTEAGLRAVMQQGAKLNGEVKAGETSLAHEYGRREVRKKVQKVADVLRGKKLGEGRND